MLGVGPFGPPYEINIIGMYGVEIGMKVNHFESSHLYSQLKSSKHYSQIVYLYKNHFNPFDGREVFF